MNSPNTSQEGLNLFVRNSYVRSSWIAFFSLWVLWGLSYFFCHIVDRDTYAEPDTEAVGASTATTPPKKKVARNSNALAERLKRSHDVLFENNLLLLSVLTLNTFGNGATRSVMILAWIFFALSLIHALTSVGIDHHLMRLAFNLVFFSVTLAIGGLSFSTGWW